MIRSVSQKILQVCFQAVKDGMAVFSIATVIVCPTLESEKLIRMSQTPVVSLIKEDEDPESRLTEYYQYFPILPLNDKMFLLSDSSYADRMWTLHEQAIAYTLYYWWQYLLGPFSEVKSKPKPSVVFRVDSMFHNNYKAGLQLSTVGDTSMSRSITVYTLRAFGPGDAALGMFDNNFSTMQTGFSLDWEVLATSILDLKAEESISDQLLCKKAVNYRSYLLQYSPPGAKYSYAWMKNAEVKLPSPLHY